MLLSVGDRSRGSNAHTERYATSSSARWVWSMPVAFCRQLHLGLHRECGLQLHCESRFLFHSAGNSMTFNSTTPGGADHQGNRLVPQWRAAPFKKRLSANTRPVWESVTPARTALNPNIKSTTTGSTSTSCSSSVRPSIPPPFNITSTSGGDMDVSYWLGGNAGQSMNLTSLTTLVDRPRFRRNQQLPWERRAAP